MKRAWAVIAFGLAACSSGGGADEYVKQEKVAATPTTRDPAEAFAVQIGVELDGDTPEMRKKFADVAVAMCDLLDSTVDGPSQDDAPNDNIATDAAISAQLTKTALDMLSDTGLPPEVSAVVLRAGAKHFCPQHTAVVNAYTADMG